MLFTLGVKLFNPGTSPIPAGFVKKYNLKTEFLKYVFFLQVNNELGVNNSFTRLVLNLGDFTPDDAFSRVPYEKGSLFLRYIEDLVGGPCELNTLLLFTG